MIGMPHLEGTDIIRKALDNTGGVTSEGQPPEESRDNEKLHQKTMSSTLFL